MQLLGRRKSSASSERPREKEDAPGDEEVNFSSTFFSWLFFTHLFHSLREAIVYHSLRCFRWLSANFAQWNFHVFRYFSDRERQDIRNSHMDGMSSDDEMPEHELTAHKNLLSKWKSPRFAGISQRLLARISQVFFSSY